MSYPDQRLSPHFTLNEFTVSQTAARLGIKVVEFVTPQIYNNIQRLCLDVLEPVRTAFDCPVIVSSGFRPQILNSQIRGSAEKSGHKDGLAADIIIPGVAPSVVAQRIAKLPCFAHIDQLIIEYDQWLHVAIAPLGDKPRRQRLRAQIIKPLLSTSYSKW
jgi:zinc D-Ala-D-Ala carboxypeptidase